MAATAAPAAAADEGTPALDLQQVVQSALADLLSGAGALHHEDSWEEPTALAPLPAAPATRRPTDQHPPAAQPAAAAAAGAARNARPSEPSFSSTSYDGEAPLQEGDLPPAAAARLYAARLRAAQGDVEGLQAALKARDSKLGALEKEVQQLRWVLGAGRATQPRQVSGRPRRAPAGGLPVPLWRCPSGSRPA